MLPVVGECDDSWRADSRTVSAEDVEQALRRRSADEVEEGTVGAGTGMMCFGFPGGIGTASRALGEHHVGVLLLCNFGDRERLDLLGTSLEPTGHEAAPRGLLHSRLRDRRAARLPASSGAWPCARCSASPGPDPTPPRARGRSASPSRPAPSRPCPDEALNPYFAAAWEAGHEAVYNCLVAARPGRLRDGTMQERLSGRACEATRPGPR